MRNSEELAELLRALGDPTRLRLLAGLSHGELTVGEITQVTGLSQPRVSRHLRLLCEARVLQRSRDQNHVYYRATIDEDRRGLVREALASLPKDDPIMLQDQARLTAILDSRRAQARELLREMGVHPLSPQAATEVGGTIDNLLRTHLAPATPGKPIGDLLDVGTGTGSMLRLLAESAERAVAVDRSREMRLVARAMVLAEGFANCTVQDGDMYGLGFPAEHFDIVTMDRVLGTGHDPGQAVREAARVLKNGGHLLVVEAAGSPVGRRQLVEWMREAGLTPVEVQQTPDGTALVVLAARRLTLSRAQVA